MDKVLVNIEKLKDAEQRYLIQMDTHNDRSCDRITYVCKQKIKDARLQPI